MRASPTGRGIANIISLYIFAAVGCAIDYWIWQRYSVESGYAGKILAVAIIAALFPILVLRHVLCSPLGTEH
ncbi:hypothetical protein [Bradyrhizobium sp. SZCCHNRI1009]|uniref:hypothetical protein n=1 Tax=Bradyrhizobium sp. SZCCHNRI1009 TaxID=3057277 RepID=UPI00291616C5|nr:hypothetical protein [Bradyrhizobium sp. SZCCHNRI1009]